MDGTIQIKCPAMVVRNTGWLPTSDRMADELPCTGRVEVAGIRVDLRNFRFPATRITFQSIGHWLAEPVTAWGDDIQIVYGPEPILRKGKLMVAQPIQNVVAESFITIAGARYAITAPLPEAPADPGWLWGMFSYTVRAVTITGTVKRVE